MRQGQWIGGRSVAGSAGQSIDVIDPSNGVIIETLDLAGPADVETAVAAASAAFDEWSRVPPVVRSDALLALGRRMAERADQREQGFACIQSA